MILKTQTSINNYNPIQIPPRQISRKALEIKEKIAPLSEGSIMVNYIYLTIGLKEFIDKINFEYPVKI